MAAVAGGWNVTTLSYLPSTGASDLGSTLALVLASRLVVSQEQVERPSSGRS